MFSSVEAEVVGLAVYFYIHVYLLLFTRLAETVVHMFFRAQKLKILLKRLTPAVHNHVNFVPCLTYLLRLVMFVYHERYPP